MRKFLALFLFISGIGVNGAVPDHIVFPDSWGARGFSLKHQDAEKVILNYSVGSFMMADRVIQGELFRDVMIPGIFLPNEKGAPNLPGSGRYIAVPRYAEVSFRVVAFRTEIYRDVKVAPAPEIPWDTDPSPLKYERNPAIYDRNAGYPENPVTVSKPARIRGIDAVMIGVTPFRYNPITRELTVFKDLEIEISFTGGNGYFGEDRLRSRWWDPLIRDAFLNEASIPEMEYSHMYSLDNRDNGCEYLIISPDNPEFVSWADTIRRWRNRQGILTKVVTLSEIGGNTATQIENYINIAYNTWTIPPAAILFLGDYGTNPANSIVSPVWDGYCISDNLYADVDNDDLPDISHARITAQNSDQLELMIGKFIDYETQPPTDPGFYDHPVTALGWQTERWFQICSETINGFWEHKLGKHPVRENAVYQGATNIWSTAPNTDVLIYIFGPVYLNYIPETPVHLTDWGGNAGRINQDINSGAFMLQHRDHGFENGWGEPAYESSHVVELDNENLTYVFSVNCLTGKFNLTGECFAEVFHRHPRGALGLIAATEVSYSFVNDTYVWGMYDNLWPGFLPDYGTNPPSRDILPAFGNAAGKYFLHQSGWPYNTSNKEVTYYLFHHHGDAFSTVYSEIPQELAITHDNAVVAGATAIEVFADSAAIIGISVNGELIGAALSNGTNTVVPIQPQSAGTMIEITVTKQNYYRYHGTVEVIPENVPFVNAGSFVLNDAGGNNNGVLDFGETILLTLTMKNIGLVQASNVTVTVSAACTYITMTDSVENFGNISPGGTVTQTDAFTFGVSGMIPDLMNIYFHVKASSGTNTWISQIVTKSHAPVISAASFNVADPGGNNNGRLDPGETAEFSLTLVNSGSSPLVSTSCTLQSDDPYISISLNPQDFGVISPGDAVSRTYHLTASAGAPSGHIFPVIMHISGNSGYATVDSCALFIGKIPALVLDLDSKNYSGPAIFNALGEMDIPADYSTVFPQNLDDYKNIFLPLGIKFSNHILTDAEGQLLKDFLLDGGNLYMEGRLSFHDDPPTPVHSMFGISASPVTYFQYQGVTGIEGTFSETMNFGYEGDYPYCNFDLIPVAPAYRIFETQNQHGIGVAYDAGNYKTIGTTFEFGQLTDGLYPSLKSELMARYLNFFDGVYTGITHIASLGEKSPEAVPNPFRGETDIRFSISEGSRISISIMDAKGNEIVLLCQGDFFSSGDHHVTWNGKDAYNRDVPEGLYLCRVFSGNTTQSFKIMRIN